MVRTASRYAFASLLVAAALAVACSGDPEPLGLPVGEETIEVVSDRFVSLGTVRPRYTCVGIDLSPDLRWSGVPEEAESIVIFLDDPDAPGGSFSHWLVYDLPASVSDIPEGRGGPSAGFPFGGFQGQNGFGGRLGYAGPCPPRGQTHAYVLRVYAIDGLLGLGARATSAEVLGAIRGRVLGHGSLSATYQRAD